MDGLKQKTINGMLFSVSERLSVQGIHLLTSIILARLLEPAEFGLIGMLAIFTSLAESILNSGFGAALIQRKNATQTDASSIFYFNLIVGVILVAVLYAAAPLIANFFDQPILIPLTRLLSLNLIINAFTLVQSALLTKNMRFIIQLKVSLAAVLLSGIVGITMAYRGMGVWSLAVQIISNNLFRAVFIWIFSRWSPSLVFSMASIKSMFSFGSRLLASAILEIIFRNIYQIFIGKFYSASNVGYYTRAATFESAATQATSTSLSRVMYPALSPLQDNNSSLKQAYRKTIRLSQFLHFPLMIGLAAIADPLIRFLLTDKWAPSIPYFQLLCIVGLFYPLQELNLNIFKVKGRSDSFLWLQMSNKFLIIMAILICNKWGILALIYGQIAVSLISYFLNSFFSGQIIGFSIMDQLKDISPSLFFAVLMGFAMYLTQKINIQNHLYILTIQICVGLMVYFIIHFINQTPELIELWNITHSFFLQIKNHLKRDQE